MEKLKAFFFLTFLLINVSVLKSQEDNFYNPKIQGTVRAKYEYNTITELSRFQVRNARLDISGNPNAFTSYRTEMDLSDRGEFKILNAYVCFSSKEWWHIKVGQQKMQFSTENLRSPHNYFFANHSFIGNQLSSAMRDVGAALMLKDATLTPVSLFAGIYNGDGLYNQGWQKDFNYSLRLVLNPIKNSNFSLNFISLKPENIRMNMYDVGAFVKLGKLHLEAEYLYKTYENNAFSDTKSFVTFAAYDIPTPKLRPLTKITPLVRFDKLTNNNRGYLDEESEEYLIDDKARSRVTAGLTFSMAKPLTNEIRLNYEHYNYDDVNHNNTDNLIVLELMVRF